MHPSYCVDSGKGWGGEGQKGGDNSREMQMKPFLAVNRSFPCVSINWVFFECKLVEHVVIHWKIIEGQSFN